MKLSLLVLRTPKPEALKAQYSALGLVFEYHRHGKGPFHYAAEMDGLVFEIYPLKRGQDKPDPHVRLGFTVDTLDALIPELMDADWTIVSEPKLTEWGYIAVVQDRDGRKVELVNRVV